MTHFGQDASYVTNWGTGLEPQYACDPGHSSQGALLSFMHTHSTGGSSK